ncbi:MAG: hypothetical protein VX738_10120 [Planctomycetota bacterium]|nr:hypothetical protein [Planctomycetota bacterium]
MNQSQRDSILISKCSKQLLGVLLIALFFQSAVVLKAEEPASSFLRALRDLRYYELAEYYLDSQVDQDLLSPEFRSKLDYERAIVMLNGARLIANGNERDKQFAAAQQLLEKFGQSTADAELKILASNELANLLFQRASLILFEAGKDENSAVREDLLESARTLLKRARVIYVEGRAQLKSELEKIPKILDPKTQQPEIARRSSLYGNYLQVMITATKLLEELGNTYPSGTPEHTAAFEEAIPEYDEIAIKYRSKGAGMLALVAQGRCYLALDKTKQSLSFLKDVVDRRETEAFRNIVNLAMPLYLQTLSHSSVDQIEEALTVGVEWNSEIRPNEAYDVEWHAFQLELARTYVKKAQKLEAANPNDREARKAYVAARKLAQEVLRYPGKYKSVARDFIASLPDLPGGTDEVVKEPETFEDALALGKERMELAQAMEFTIKNLPATIAAETDEQVKTDLQTQLREARENYKSTQASAVTYYELALQFTNAETPVEQLQEVYYYLTFIYYSRKHYFEAAVMGEYLARRYPGTNAALPCAKIALNCYQLLYNEAPADERQFEVLRLIDIADYTIQNWESSDEAIDARRRLVPYMIEAGRFEDARQFTLDIPEGAPERLESELRLGRSLWNRYRAGAAEHRKLRENQSNPARLAELETELPALRDAAAEMLVAGTTRLAANAKTTTLTSSTANSVLAACQYYVEVGQPAEALVHLEADLYGLLTLIRKQDPAVSRASLVEQSYRNALSAYIALLGSGSDAQANIEKAKVVMADLNKAVGNTPDGQKRLVSIYFTLARELESQLALASSEQQRQALANGFETFLNEVGKTSDKFSVRHWVGATMQSLGNGFEVDGKLTPQSKVYYEKAIAQFSAIKEKGTADPGWVNEDPKTSAAYMAQIRMNMAQVMKKTGDYKGASVELAHILLKTPSNVSVQIEAAKTYSELGRREKDKTQFLYAIGGARKLKSSGENLIWGWRKISRLTQGKDNFKDEYYESRLGITQARLGYAQLQQGDEKKKQLGYAKMEILNTQKIYPELGGPEFKLRFNELLKLVQTALGERPTGLPKS